VIRVVGTDPGTSSLDLLLLVDGEVVGQARLTPEVLQADPCALVAVLRGWEPLDLVAGPSGYGLPLVRSELFQDKHLEEMSLVRPDEKDRPGGVIGFRRWVRSIVGAGIPTVFLPGGVHLPTIPKHRKVNAIDLGTADKVAVVALALWAECGDRQIPPSAARFALVEIGTVFTAILVVAEGKIVDTSAGTRGPIGVRSGGSWDGEVAHWRAPLFKGDLFRGGLVDLGPLGPDAFRESLAKHTAALQAITPFERIYLSGASLQDPGIASLANEALLPFGELTLLPSLPNAWVKHAAQGSALLADGLAGGRHGSLLTSLALREASGTVWDYLAPL
jgi:predicted butyrate kinase (DUF1464 family)